MKDLPPEILDKLKNDTPLTEADIELLLPPPLPRIWSGLWTYRGVFSLSSSVDGVELCAEITKRWDEQDHPIPVQAVMVVIQSSPQALEGGGSCVLLPPHAEALARFLCDCVNAIAAAAAVLDLPPGLLARRLASGERLADLIAHAEEAIREGAPCDTCCEDGYSHNAAFCICKCHLTPSGDIITALMGKIRGKDETKK